MKHSIGMKVRRVFCSDDNCEGLHREPFAACSCGWSKWVGSHSVDATRAEQRRVYNAARDEHLGSVKEAA